MNNRDRITKIKSSLIKWLAFAGISLIFGSNCTPARGQIVPDNTLGNESSQVRSNLKIENLPSELIEGGAKRDSNLFHSFRQFNIEAGRGAYFANPEGITNIFSRVTGGNVSEIMGKLGVLGNADLFLIDPNGIIFGETSSLDINGSFFASTANGIVFDNGFEFDTVNPEAPPLLTVNLPLGLNLGNSPGEIVNQSLTDNLGLQVSPGKNISLIGGEITLERGLITAPGGKVELGGLATAGFIAINESGNWDFPSEVAKAPLSLNNGSFIDVRADSGGLININASSIQLTAASGLLAGIRENGGSADARSGNITLNATETISLDGGSRLENQVNQNGIGNSGAIDINTSSLFVNDGSVITTDTFGRGNGGLISIQALDRAELSGTGTAIFSDVNPSAVGNAGGIAIEADSFSASDGAIISSSIFGQGDSGNVTLQANSISLVEAVLSTYVIPPLDSFSAEASNAGKIEISTGSLEIANSRVDSSNQGLGNAGSIAIDAQDNVAIASSLVYSLLGSPIEGSSNGGIEINADSLSVTNNAELNSSLINGGKGSAGNIVINASDTVTFDGGFARSRLEKGAEGNGGDISINTNSLLVTGVPGNTTGQLTTATFGRGDAGSVIINASGDVAFDGQGSDVFSLVALDEGIGNGGKIIINSKSLSINNQARLIAINEAFGDAGDIVINTDSISVTNGGQINTYTSDKETNAEIERSRNGGSIEINTKSFTANSEAILNAGSSGSGDAGNIIIRASESAYLDDATIFASTLREGGGGNINLEIADTLLLQNNSDIFTTAGSETTRGEGGNIRIATNSLRLENSLIDASTFGIRNAGTIKIDATESVEVRGFGLRRLQEEILNPALENPVLIQSIFSLENSENIDSLTIQGIIAFTSGQGEAGGIEINTPRLNVSDGSIIGTSSILEGMAGSIVINTPELLEINEANITVSTIGTGDAGNLEINTGKLSINNGGQIDATTFQEGNGGNLTIRATESVVLKGVFDNDDSIPSSLLVGAQREETTGDAGNLQIFTPQLTLRDGATIDATTLGRGNGGNIQLEISDLLLLRNNSTISTRAGISGAGGNGGNIKINAGFLVAFPSENSDIDANAFQGKGGAIQISTQGIFGIAERTQQTSLSDITAFSQQNPQLDGEVTIETSDTDLNRELNKLPEGFIDLSALVAPTCPRNSYSSSAKVSEFIVTGRGGLPPEPEDNFRVSAIAVRESSSEQTPTHPAIIEATSWVHNEGGKLMLVASPMAKSVPDYHSNTTSCN